MKILSFIKILSIIVLMSLSICSFTGAGRASGKSDHGWVSLFNGKDLKGWDTYLGPESDSTGKRVSDQPIGLNKDPRHVFSVVKDETAGAARADGGENVIRISGEGVGALTTQKEFENYHLQLMFRWGALTWGAKKNKKKDSGLLYHSVGPYGADFGAWMRSQEFQVQEGDCGDYWGCAGGLADIPALKKSDSEYVYNAAGALTTFRADNAIGRHCIKGSDAEKPSGQWNTLDLYCHGDTSVHIVNGRLMMILYHNGQSDKGKVTPLTKGKIQLQSEGAEVFYKAVKIQFISTIPPGILK
ncbi:MAG TPA: DUF1080 domain-containing protein [Puia sp.]